MPAKNAAIVATNGSAPPTISAAATAAPSGKLPSGVMSGKRSTRDAMYTPQASDANASPSTSAESQNSHGLALRFAARPGDFVDATPAESRFTGITVDARLMRSGG